MFKSYDEFKKIDRELREQGAKLSDRFLTHIKEGLSFFHTEGNHNVQIINDMMDTASAMRLQRNRIIDWVSPMVGHEVVKLAGGLFGFGKKKDDIQYDDVVSKAPEHFAQFPDWYAWKPEAKPAEFDGIEDMRKLVKKLRAEAKKYTDNGYTSVGAMLTAEADKLQVVSIIPDSVDAGEPEKGETIEDEFEEVKPEDEQQALPAVVNQ